MSNSAANSSMQYGRTARKSTFKPTVSRERRLNINPSLASWRRAVTAMVMGVAAGTAPTSALSEDAWPEVWVSPGIYSHHFDRSKGLRDENWGLGAEVALTREHVVMAGSFINSNRARSHYAAYQWRPLQWQVANLKVGAGIAVGAFDGYPNYRNGAWFVAPLPLVSVEGRYIGANFGIVPKIKNRLDGAFAIQIKLRVR